MAEKTGFALSGKASEAGKKGGKKAQAKYEGRAAGEPLPHRFVKGSDEASEAAKKALAIRWARYRENNLDKMREEVRRLRDMEFTVPASNPQVDREYENLNAEKRRLKAQIARATKSGVIVGKREDEIEQIRQEGAATGVETSREEAAQIRSAMMSLGMSMRPGPTKMQSLMRSMMPVPQVKKTSKRAAAAAAPPPPPPPVAEGAVSDETAQAFGVGKQVFRKKKKS
jgi:hypothetical protein